MEAETKSLHWSTNALRPDARFAAWRDAVNATHLSWDIRANRDVPFDADIKQSLLGAARIIECVCDPCGGRRERVQIGATTNAYFGMLHVISGRERIRQSGREVWLAPGDVVLWDSTRAIDFDIGEKLHKVTFLFPQTLLGSSAMQYEDLVAQVLPAQRASTALLSSHLKALAAYGGQIGNKSVVSVLEATLDLLRNALHADKEVDTSSRYVQTLIARIQSYVLENLSDPELSADRVAHAHGISRRQLHRIFRFTDSTVEKWIWSERLRRCRQDLSFAQRESISGIAFRWGFRDASHFSRAFRATYGVTPQAWRLSQMGKTPK